MKGEERHRLETNALADWLGTTIEGIKPYRNAILACIVLVAVCSGVYAWHSRQSAEQSALAWDDLYQAMSTGEAVDPDAISENLGDIIKKYPGTRVAHTAAVIVADQDLGAGCNELFINKGNANVRLNSAVEHYLKVLKESDEPMLRQRATFGLARARESLGDLGKAAESYSEVTKNWPRGAFADMARQRLADLKKPSTKAFYDAFAKFVPKPAPSEGPGVPGKRPKFDLDSIPDDGTKPAAGEMFPPTPLGKVGEKKPDNGGPADSEPKSTPEPPAK